MARKPDPETTTPTTASAPVGAGGRYVNNPDGTTSLVERTEQRDPRISEEPAEARPAPAEQPRPAAPSTTHPEE
ncbi:MAG: hypothetical protein IPP91_11305 [Betaproteobacteria bacterium]|nr:hypothetical protein [Betaproteobacteria bacterium]